MSVSASSRSAGSGSPCRACPAPTTTSSCRCTASTRRRNAALALAAVEALIGAGPQPPIDPDAVRAAFAAVARPAGWSGSPPGRTSPTVLVDAAHNPHGARALAAALTAEFRFTRLVGVLGGMRDKDARGILAELEPVLAEVVVTANSSPRAMDPDELGALAVEVFGEERVSVEPVLEQAIEQARELAEEEGASGAGVIVTGSVVTAGEARRAVRPGAGVTEARRPEAPARPSGPREGAARGLRRACSSSRRSSCCSRCWCCRSSAPVPRRWASG